MNVEMDQSEEELNELTHKIIGCAYRVHNILKGGFAEKVYENAMVVELSELGLRVKPQWPIVVMYRGVVVGEYFADLWVADKVLVELKAVCTFDDSHTAQCLNYIAATQAICCLLLNFGKRVEVKRFRGSIDSI